MPKPNLINRWFSDQSFNSEYYRVLNLFSHGGKYIANNESGQVLIEGKLDLRGINVESKKIVGCNFDTVDFTFATFSQAWIETCHFEKCLFSQTDFSNFSDHNNHFENCVFNNCKFNFSAIGYKGTRFRNCVFEKCNFTKTTFIRPEFSLVQFVKCRLKNIDFNGSFFENCFFEGELKDVWFRGGFPLLSDEEYFGKPKKGGMKNVSFENAELIDLTFSDNCDLSTVSIKKTDKYLKYDNWKKRLDLVNVESERWDEMEKKEAKVFFGTYMVHAKKQDWIILNIESIERDFGKIVAKKIITILDQF